MQKHSDITGFLLSINNFFTEDTVIFSACAVDVLVISEWNQSCHGNMNQRLCDGNEKCCRISMEVAIIMELISSLTAFSLQRAVFPILWNVGIYFLSLRFMYPIILCCFVVCGTDLCFVLYC